MKGVGVGVGGRECDGLNQNRFSPNTKLPRRQYLNQSRPTLASPPTTFEPPPLFSILILPTSWLVFQAQSTTPFLRGIPSCEQPNQPQVMPLLSLHSSSFYSLLNPPLPVSQRRFRLLRCLCLRNRF